MLTVIIGFDEDGAEYLQLPTPRVAAANKRIGIIRLIKFNLQTR